MVLASCLNPINFVPPEFDIPKNGDGVPGEGVGETVNGEGQFTNEGGTVDTGNTWWDSNRNRYGLLQVKNLSSRVAITKVELESGAKHFAMDRVSPRSDRSIVLATETWSVTLHYTVNSTALQKKARVSIHPVGLTGRLNYLYFYYTGSDYDVALGDSPPDYQEDSGGGASSPGYKEGDSPGALNDTNRDTLGLLILRNLSPDIAVDSAGFTQRTTFPMVPGPAVKDQKSILLGPGDWQVSATYTITTSATTGPKTATIVAGQVSYMYFYKTHSGGYALSPSWPPNPNDSASDNADPGAIIGDDEGWLNVINNSASGAIIDRVQYNNGGTWIDIAIPGATGTIAPGNASDPDLVVFKGSWSFRFKTLVKQTYSRSVSRTIRAGQTVDITYTDVLDADEPPDGYGTLKIVNDSGSSVYRVKSSNLTLNGNEQTVELNISSGQNEALVLKAPTASGSSYSYSVKCYISSAGSTRYVQTQVNIENQKLSIITITNDSPTVVESGNDGKGHIRVYNNYDNYEARRAGKNLRATLPVQFFKVALKGIGGKALGSNVVKGGVNPDDDQTSGPLSLRAGAFTQLDVDREGQYELWILWGNTIANDTTATTLTKYGIYDIAQNTQQDIYIDFYSLNTAESSAVNMRLTHVGYPSASSISQFQLWYGGDDPHYDDPGEGRIPKSLNAPTNDTYIVYKNNDVLYAGDSREFKLVPGKKYYARIHWPLWNWWGGHGGFNSGSFLLVQLAPNASTGFIQYVWDDQTVGPLAFFSDQATGVALQTIEAARSLLYRPAAVQPGDENSLSNYYGLKSVMKNGNNSYITGIDITPYIGTYPVVYAENKYFDAVIHWFKRKGVISNTNVGWGVPEELAYTGAWSTNDVVYTETFKASDASTNNPAGWYYAEVILTPKQGYDISKIPANKPGTDRLDHFFGYDDYSLDNSITTPGDPLYDPLFLATTNDDGNNGGNRAKGKISYGAPGSSPGVNSVMVTGSQIKVRLWFRETQPYPNPSGGASPPANAPPNYPQYP
ncbi:MAG: hypothetical protein LBU00_00010 [Treponema sp.]|nr:hypothetical protein [Treponema sp.]